MLRHWGALILATTLVAAGPIQKPAPSQPPPPSAGKLSSEQQQKATTANQPAAEDKRGTNDVPLVVKMTNPPNGNGIAAEIKRNREDQSAEDWRAVIFNGLLVVVGILQAAALIYTAKVANKAANAAKAAAEALPILERAYLFVESVEEGTVDTIDGGKKGRDGISDIKFPTDEFGDPLMVGEITRGAQVTTRYKNHGKTPAIIKSIKSRVRYFPNTPELVGVETKFPDAFIVSSGAISRPFYDGLVIRVDEFRDAQELEGGIYLVGVVSYSDIFKNIHETGFCWKWSPFSKKFYIEDSPLNFFN